MSFEDRTIVVKNDDTSITYLGEWTTVQASVVNGFGNFGPALSATLHSTKTISSFSFPFHGSSINVFGSINIANSSTDPNPSWQCVLNGIDLGAPNIFQFPENNWSLCSQANIPDGAHELVVNVTSKGMPFYFDYIEYRPSANVSLENALIMIDNVDPGIDYISGWTNLGATANQTTDPKGLVNVTFVGIQLSWYGFVPTEEAHNASSGEYSIDGQPFSSFQLLGLPPGSNIATSFNQLFFTTPSFEMGTHTLSAKYTGSSGQTPLTLDYLLVTNGSFPPTTSSPAGSVPNSSKGAGGSPTSVTTNASNHKASSNVGAIVGGIVGGIGGLAICSIILFIWLRSRRKRRAGDGNHSRTRRDLIEPYSTQVTQPQVTNVSQSALLTTERNGGTSYATTSTNTNSHRHHPSQPSISQSSAMYTVSSSDPPSSLNNSSSSPPATDTRFSGTIASTTTTSSGSSRPLPIIPPFQMIPPIPQKNAANVPEPRIHAVQHEDSGIRLPEPANAQVVEIPPTYSEQ